MSLEPEGFHATFKDPPDPDATCMNRSLENGDGTCHIRQDDGRALAKWPRPLSSTSRDILNLEITVQHTINHHTHTHESCTSTHPHRVCAFIQMSPWHLSRTCFAKAFYPWRLLFSSAPDVDCYVSSKHSTWTSISEFPESQLKWPHRRFQDAGPLTHSVQNADCLEIGDCGSFFDE